MTVVCAGKLDLGLVRLLVTNGADVNLQDAAGDTPSHLAALVATEEVGEEVEGVYSNSLAGMVDEADVEEMKRLVGARGRAVTKLGLLCYLVLQGAEVMATNGQCRTVLDNLAVGDGGLKEFLVNFVRTRGRREEGATAQATGGGDTTNVPEPEYAEVTRL